MSGGRPRTVIGAHGEIWVNQKAKNKYVAGTWVRDDDGKMRQATATGSSRTAATGLLKERLLQRRGVMRDGQLDRSSPFTKLADLWLGDLDLQDLAENSRQVYRDQLRLHVLPALEHFMLGEITTGRVEWVLKTQRATSISQARKCRTVLNLLFNFALRQDAIARNPVSGTSPLPRPKEAPRSLTLEQVAAIRKAAASWRTEPGLPGPKPDGNVRDIIEVLLGTGMRPGEALAVRPCDVTDGRAGMVVKVTGTVVQTKGKPPKRQEHPKTHASVRFIPVPNFAAEVLRRRMATLSDQPERTIFANRNGGVLTLPNVRRTFREFLVLAGLEHSGISLRWYRRTAATVVARAMGADAASGFLGHTSAAITEGYYIEPDPTVDLSPAMHLERTLRAMRPDPALLSAATSDEEDDLLDDIDPVGEDDPETTDDAA